MTETDDEHEGTRLQKVLAQAGIASRRASEQLIRDGRVEVNGELVTEQGRRVDPEKDEIRVDGSRIPTARRHVYTVLNKPRGVVSTMDDPEGRETLSDYIDRRNVRLFHVGRLDTETEGLIILTNDGEFAHRLAHPSYEVPKTYVAQVLGQVSPHTLKRIQRGITLEDGPVRPDKVKVMQTLPDATLLQITLHEGRNRVVRRMMEAFGHPVQKLTRIAVGPVRLGRLQPGEMRDLTHEELGKLLDLVGM
ncbi:pseudouridine synthase [Raineyella sp.]|uniref:Putative RNA pseudouridine synthase n=1 Tax=bioreactor metagenome TaxID=1076179 RepID=A0A644ZDV5_9ZZZZ|nr:pseudouridine synthase [Raineyella sp.]MEA5154534.1 pseudouridine synthase [Raineyella sp.]